jgi:hypothetical protein
MYIFVTYIVLIIAYVLSIFVDQKVLKFAKLFYCKVLECELKSHKCDFNFKNNFKRSNNFA